MLYTLQSLLNGNNVCKTKSRSTLIDWILDNLNPNDFCDYELTIAYDCGNFDSINLENVLCHKEKQFNWMKEGF